MQRKREIGLSERERDKVRQRERKEIIRIKEMHGGKIKKWACVKKKLRTDQIKLWNLYFHVNLFSDHLGIKCTCSKIQQFDIILVFLHNKASERASKDIV